MEVAQTRLQSPKIEILKTEVAASCFVKFLRKTIPQKASKHFHLYTVLLTGCIYRATGFLVISSYLKNCLLENTVQCRRLTDPLHAYTTHIQQCDSRTNIDTKAKCRHIKKLTFIGTLWQVCITVQRLEIQSVLLVFSTELCDCFPSNLLSSSTLPLFSLPCVKVQFKQTVVAGRGWRVWSALETIFCRSLTLCI